MKKIVLLTLMIGCLTSVYSADRSEESESAVTAVVNVAGIVTDQLNGESLTGAAIELDGKTVYTDFEGRFNFDKVDVGSHNLKIALISYEDKVINLDLQDMDDELEIKLKSIEQ